MHIFVRIVSDHYGAGMLFETPHEELTDEEVVAIFR
jgi:hypothetical protein